MKTPSLAAALVLAVTLSSVETGSAQPVAQPSRLEPLDAAGKVTYYIGAGAPGSGYVAGDDELAAWALGAWQRAAPEGALVFTPSEEEAALVRVYFVAAGFGQYGEARALDLGGRRGAAVYIRPDTSALGTAIAGLTTTDPLLRDAIVYLTCLHELGHALGLLHTADFADIMYSFQFGGDIPAYFGRYREQLDERADIARVSGLSAGDIARLRTLYAEPPKDQ
jgi:hypothetical protein